MTGSPDAFDVTPFLHQDEGQHFDRKSLFHGPPDAKKQRDRRAVRDEVARYVAGFSHESRPSALKLAYLNSELLAQARRGAGLESLSDADYLLKRKLADRRGSELVLRQAAELLFARLGPEHPNAGVRVFDDRMEVVSPGGLLPALNLQELLSRKRVHCSRNPRLMRTLVDLGLTRDQGEGIPGMFAEMEDAFLSAPRIEPTTLTEADRSFVERLASEELTQEEFRALLQAHRQTQVDNASLRQLIGLDTLGPALLAGDRPDQGKLALDRGELAADRGGFPADRGGLGPDRGGLEPDRGGVLDPELQQVIASLGTRPRKEKLRQAIGQLCTDQWRSVAWLAALLKLQPRNLSDRHLTPMLKDGLLERRFPDIPSHPDQAYRSMPSPVHAATANPKQEDNA
jgi:ATP-dependent DNA helicase RecG